MRTPLWRSVQAAVADRRLAGPRIAGSRGLQRTGRRGRRTGRRRGSAVGRLVSNELIVTGRARSRRNIVGLAAGPVRPMIGNKTGKLAARAQSQAETEHYQSHSRPLDYHADRRIVSPSARRSNRSIRLLAAVDRASAPLTGHRSHNLLRSTAPAGFGLEHQCRAFKQTSTPPDELYSWRDCVSARDWSPAVGRPRGIAVQDAFSHRHSFYGLVLKKFLIGGNRRFRR
jgi:hypothetical protein